MTYDKKRSLYESIMKSVAKIVRDKINNLSSKSPKDSEFSTMSDDDLMNKMYSIEQELQNRHYEQISKRKEEKEKVRKQFTKIDDIYKDTIGGNCGDDFYVVNNRLEGGLNFGPGEDAPVWWSKTWGCVGKNVGDIFEKFNSIEEASKYKVKKKFKGEYMGSIDVFFEDMDPRTLDLYNEWKKNSRIRLSHSDKIARDAKLYFKYVFSVGAEGRDDFIYKMRDAEKIINSYN